MEIDWNRVIGDAEESPRAVLARCLAEADSITSVVVIMETGNPHDPQSMERFVGYEASGPGMATLGLLEYAKANILKDIL